MTLERGFSKVPLSPLLIILQLNLTNPELWKRRAALSRKYSVREQPLTH